MMAASVEKPSLRPAKRKVVAWIMAALGAVVFALTLFLFRPVPVVSGPLPSAVYLWQRQWTASVRSGLEQAGPFAEVCVAYAEIEHSAGSLPTVNRTVGVDWRLLAHCGQHIGFALRVHEFPGEVSVGREPFPTLRAVVAELCQAAQQAGLQPAEIQVDFDCPTSRLLGFATWLEDLRRDFPGQTFRFTALPAWLHSRDFARLAHAAPGYILQLHWLAKPDAAGRPPGTLCDPAQARAAVEQAARLGIPFRVALPTYGYRLVLDAQGRLLAAAAEASRLQMARPPPGGSCRTLMADPTALAGLIAGWQARRPAALQGIIWYRLPVSGERLNWQPRTLQAVMAGRSPEPQFTLKFEAASAPDGPCELRLCNEGEADAIAPNSIKVECPAIPAAEDGLGGFEVDAERALAKELIFKPRWKTPDREPLIVAAGKSILVGWVRLENGAGASTAISEYTALLDPPGTFSRP